MSISKSFRRLINTDFGGAFILSDVRAGDLAATGGLPPTQLSRPMNAPAVVATPRSVKRLRPLAGRIVAEHQP